MTHIERKDLITPICNLLLKLQSEVDKSKFQAGKSIYIDFHDDHNSLVTIQVLHHLGAPDILFFDCTMTTEGKESAVSSKNLFIHTATIDEYLDKITHINMVWKLNDEIIKEEKYLIV